MDVLPTRDPRIGFNYQIRILGSIGMDNEIRGVIFHFDFLYFTIPGDQICDVLFV